MENENISFVNINRIPEMNIVPLFGGHFQIELPAKYVDLSDVRQIPDHQEVYFDSWRDHSVIIELVEYNEIPEENLLKFHWAHLCQENSCPIDEQIVYEEINLNDNEKILPEISGDKIFKKCCIGLQKIAKAKETAKNSVLIFLTVITLPQYSTEILISMNLPILVDIKSTTFYEGRETAMKKEDQEYWFGVYKYILESFKLIDDSIFS